MKRKTAKSSFGAAVIGSLKEFINAADRGEPMTARTVKLVLEEKRYTNEEIKQIRATFGVSQPIFAQLLSISVKTVQAWESGLQEAPPIACRLFDEIKVDPKAWLARRIGNMSTTTPAAKSGRHLVEH